MAVKPTTIAAYIKLFMQRRFVESKRLRKLIDRDPLIKQYFDLDEKYYNRYNKFIDAYNEAVSGMTEDEARASQQTLNLGEISDRTGQGMGSIQIRSATRIIEEKANFRQIKNFYNKLIPELKEAHQFGHKNISVLRSSIALVLDADKKTPFLGKKERKQLLALYEVVKQLDKLEKITGTFDENKANLIEYVKEIAEKGPDVSVSWKKDVSILTGIKGSIQIEAENTELNQFKGTLASWIGEIYAGIIREDTEIFEKTFGDVDLSKLKGSNSIEEDIQDAFLHYLGKGKKRNFSIKEPKPTRTKSSSVAKTPVKKEVKRKSAKSPVRTLALRKRAKSKQANKSASQIPLHMIGIMNQQLPKVITNNMKSPRLVNRTGRFAGSVRVTDITKTAQGYPSIGYTYQTNPYQTFETGFAQGSQERDPRKLIDTSIREVAVQFAMGRFYTRRV